jgi:hypothetical protein
MTLEEAAQWMADHGYFEQAIWLLEKDDDEKEKETLANERIQQHRRIHTVQCR